MEKRNDAFGAAGILKSAKAVGVMEFFIRNHGEEFYQLEVSERLGLSRNTAVKWLTALSGNGMLSARKSGNMTYYRLAAENVIVRQLKILLTVSKLADVLKALGAGSWGVEVYLYGSAARGEDDKGSDIDLMFVGKIGKEDLVRAVDGAKKATKKDVRPLVMDPLEYASLPRKDKAFYDSMEKNKVRLL
jgi:predicted nucleotidyltransferase